MTGASDWIGTVGRSWAAEWRRTDASFAQLTPQLLALIGEQPGKAIVDVGCGAGELSIALASARPEATVTGVDISEDLIKAASLRADLPNLGFECADATQWQPQQSPDLYVSRHGVMFFPDPLEAFAHLAEVAAPHARIVFSCFRKAADNAWAARIAELLPPGDSPALQPFAPGPFAFADPDHVRRCMAGWHDHTFTPVDFGYVAGQGDDPVEGALALFRRIGPAAPALRALPGDERSALEQRLRDVIEGHLEGGRVIFPAAAWLVTASSDHRNG